MYRLEQWLDWCNFQAPIRQPLAFLWSYIRPVWMADHGGQWGFYPHSRGADVGEFGSDKATVRKAFDFAHTAPAPVIVDLEKYWPSGRDWSFVSCGPATKEKLLACAISAGRSIQLLDAIIAERPTPEIPIGVYAPGNFWDKAGPNFVKLYVNGYAKLFAAKLDFLVIDVYAHPDERNAKDYEARVRANIQAYKTLGLPIVVIVKYSANKTDPIGFLKAAKKACEAEQVKAIAFWDELNLSWSDEIGRAYEAIR